MRTWKEILEFVPAPGAAVDWSAICNLFPELQSLSLVHQDPRHHAEGNVFVHTQMCIMELLSDPQWAALPRDEQVVLFLATLFHDLGKKIKTVQDDDGSIRAPHHARAGAYEARRMLWYAGAPIAMRERICNLIALHQVLFHALEDGAPDLDWLLRRVSLKTPIFHLLILGRADTKGRLPAQQSSLDCLELLAIRAYELGCLYGPATFPDDVCRLRYLEGRGARSHEVPTFDAKGSQVTLLSGLPASGKDTWISRQGNLPSVSFDDARAELGLKHGDNDGQARQNVMEKARTFLRQQVPFVWNATFLSQEMRQRPVNLVSKYHGEIHAVCLECSPEELFRRNRNRAASVPEDAIMGMLRLWEPPGLDEVSSVVYLLPDGSTVEGNDLLVTSHAR